MTYSWTPNHTKLCNTLAQLYLHRDDAVRITVQAGINPALVTFNDNAENNWYEIIKQADNQGLLVQLIKQASSEFPTNNTVKEALVFFEARDSDQLIEMNRVSPTEKNKSIQTKEPTSGIQIWGNPQIKGNINTGTIYGNMNYESIHIKGVGPGAQVVVGKQGDVSQYQGITGRELGEVQKLISNVQADLEKQDLQEITRAEGKENIDQIEQEITKNDAPPDGVKIVVAGDWLLKNIPAIAGTLTTLFSNPIVGKVVDAAGEVASKWVQETFL